MFLTYDSDITQYAEDFTCYYCGHSVSKAKVVKVIKYGKEARFLGGWIPHDAMEPVVESTNKIFCNDDCFTRNVLNNGF